MRNRVEHKLADGTPVFISEFSMPSAISQIVSLGNLVRSDKTQERDLFNKILKNAVILQTVTMQKGPYKAMR